MGSIQLRFNVQSKDDASRCHDVLHRTLFQTDDIPDHTTFITRKLAFLHANLDQREYFLFGDGRCVCGTKDAANALGGADERMQG